MDSGSWHGMAEEARRRRVGAGCLARADESETLNLLKPEELKTGVMAPRGEF